MFDKMREDIRTICERDPAARSALEVMLLYNGYKAVRSHARAAFFYRHGMKFLARWISQRCVRRTNIEIHPAAKIGRRFFIDHGTGVVIGETTVIGDRVQLYQGVTLGAMSPAGMHHSAETPARRHPKVGSDVTIYAGATLLGGATEVGDNVVIGGNAFLTESVESDTKVSIKKPEMTFRVKGGRF